MLSYFSIFNQMSINCFEIPCFPLFDDALVERVHGRNSRDNSHKMLRKFSSKIKICQQLLTEERRTNVRGRENKFMVINKVKIGFKCLPFLVVD